jgi:hypothetical protein
MIMSKQKDPRTMTQTIFPPINGWKEHTLYLVDVSMNAGNPMHKALFYSGFLQDGWPCGYNGITSMIPSNDEGPREIHSVYYMKVIKELYTHDATQCQGLPPKATELRKDPLADLIDQRIQAHMIPWLKGEIRRQFDAMQTGAAMARTYPAVDQSINQFLKVTYRGLDYKIVDARQPRYGEYFIVVGTSALYRCANTNGTVVFATSGPAFNTTISTMLIVEPIKG